MSLNQLRPICDEHPDRDILARLLVYFIATEGESTEDGDLTLCTEILLPMCIRILGTINHAQQHGIAAACQRTLDQLHEHDKWAEKWHPDKPRFQTNPDTYRAIEALLKEAEELA